MPRTKTDAQGYQVYAPKGGWDGRRVASFGISDQFFEQLFREGGPRCFEIVEGIPKDGKIVAVRYVPWERMWYLAVESEAFDPLPEMDDVPNRYLVERAFYNCKCQPVTGGLDADD